MKAARRKTEESEVFKKKKWAAISVISKNNVFFSFLCVVLIPSLHANSIAASG